MNDNLFIGLGVLTEGRARTLAMEAKKFTIYSKGKYIYYAEGGGGDEDVKGGAPKYFLALKGGALKVLDILKAGYKLFKVLVQQGPGVFTQFTGSLPP